MLACIGIVYAAVYMLRLYQTSTNGPPRGGRLQDAELRAADLALLLPLVAIMFLIALWLKSLVGATTATLERIDRPGLQAAAGRPAEEIRAVVVPNLPPAVQPLPGDEEAGEVAPSQNVVAATPIIIVAGTATLALGAGLPPGATLRRHGSALVGIAGIVAAFVMTAVLWGDRQEAFNGGLRADRFSPCWAGSSWPRRC